LPERFGSQFYSEYPVFCNMNLAWQEKQFVRIPRLYWTYLRNYAIREYGFTPRLLRRAFRMAACGLLPPGIYRKLGFYSHL
jgi:hypothetical protein